MILSPSRTVRCSLSLAAGAIAALTFSGTASAQGYAAKMLGDWTVTASRDGAGCFVTRTYDMPGATTLMLGLNRDGGNHVTILNDNWSIKPQDRLTLDFRLSSGGYANHAAVGLISGGKPGFTTSFEGKFPAYLAASQRLDVARGKVPVAQLPLDGSAEAIAELRRCVGARAGDAPATSRSLAIPADPFAPEAKSTRDR